MFSYLFRILFNLLLLKDSTKSIYGFAQHKGINFNEVSINITMLPVYKPKEQYDVNAFQSQRTFMQHVTQFVKYIGPHTTVNAELILTKYRIYTRFSDT